MVAARQGGEYLGASTCSARADADDVKKYTFQTGSRAYGV